MAATKKNTSGESLVMKRVSCALPNATSPINGIEFALSGDVLLSVELTEEVANQFLDIPGYAILDVEPVTE